MTVGSGLVLCAEPAFMQELFGEGKILTGRAVMGSAFTIEPCPLIQSLFLESAALPVP
jgi:hypothetical protein